MQVLARELVWIHRRAVFSLFASADVKQDPLVAQPFTTADECRMPAEDNKVAISAFCHLAKPRTIAFPVRGGSYIWIEPVP